MDNFSKTDPCARVYTRDSAPDEWHFVGATETKQNDLNPDFEKSFNLSYYFEK